MYEISHKKTIFAPLFNEPKSHKLMINVYFKDRALTICKKDDALLKEQDVVLLHPSDERELSDVPEMFVGNIAVNHLAIAVEDLSTEEDTFNKIFSKVRPINAGGGVIQSGDKYLMILRRGVWDMSKGKQERGEDIKLTAQREIKEEVGLECTPQELITVTHHLYKIGDALVIKHTHWFKMEADNCPKTTPQTEEEIERCEWFNAQQIKELMPKTFASIRELIYKAGIVKQ